MLQWNIGLKKLSRVSTRLFSSHLCYSTSFLGFAKSFSQKPPKSLNYCIINCLHLIIVNVESALEATNEVKSEILECGNDNNWRSIGGVASEDGKDILDGLGGNDKLYGGAGNDTLKGGLGNDQFAFSAGGGVDTILDGEAGDVVQFNGNNISGKASNLENGTYKLGSFALQKSGSDLTLVTSDGSGMIVKNFFHANDNLIDFYNLNSKVA